MAKHPGAQVFHCRHYYLHVFLNEENCKQHESEECPHHPDRVREREAERVRKQIEERERQMLLDSEDDYNEDAKNEDEPEVEASTYQVIEVTLKPRPHFVCTTMTDPRKRFKASHNFAPNFSPLKPTIIDNENKENSIHPCIKASKPKSSGQPLADITNIIKDGNDTHLQQSENSKQNPLSLYD